MVRRLGDKMGRLVPTRAQPLDHGALVRQARLGVRAPGISSTPVYEMGKRAKRTNLSFLGLNLFVKFVCFVLVMGKHRL